MKNLPPARARWIKIRMALLCGIGFTMSLFIGGLAFDDPAHGVQVRIGVLAGSILSAVIGAAIIKWAQPLSAPS